MKRILLTAILALAALSATAQTLVVYYSRTGQNYTSDGIVDLKVGNTAVVAKQIQKLTGADIFQLETVKQYAADYFLKADIDISKYDTIYLGWPCWWGTYPMCVATFLEAHDWSGKTVIPFTTHEGSGFGSGLRDLKAAIPSATVKKGLSIQGSKVKTAGKQIEEFVKGQK